MDHDHDLRHRTALIAYGSETGTAHDYAKELGSALERLHFGTEVCSLDSVELASLPRFTVVLIVISTTGQGDLPANSRALWKRLLRKKLRPDCLQNVEFSSFGLGDSSYPRYNWAVRKIHKRLLQLGATEFYNRGEADEQHDEGLDAAYMPWLVGLRRQLLDRFPLPVGLTPIPEDVLRPPKWLLTLAEDENGNATTRQAIGLVPEDDALHVELTENRRMTPVDHWQDVRHLVFTSETAVSYEPGDVLTIYPQNAREDVDHILRLMRWVDVAKKLVTITQVNAQEPTVNALAPPITALSHRSIPFEKLVRDHLDLNAIPRRSFFSSISYFTTDHFQRERLLEFTKLEYIDELFDYTTRPRRSILEVLQEFDTVKIPWQWAANVLPELRGRQFSIASGGHNKNEANGNTRFELLVAIVKYKTVIKKMREGVCTKYLAGLAPGTQLPAKLQKGDLGMSMTDPSRPMVLIGPGTGIAPIRSLLWERAQKVGKPETATAENLLIYGCRNQSADFFYRHEWEALKNKMLLEVYTAFSRDQRTKIYVQDIVQQQKSKIYRLLHDQGGVAFICGSSGKMPTAVRAALADVFRECGCISQSEADAYLQKMEREGRYKQETWG